MKIVHFSDLHLDSAFSTINHSAASRRRQALRDTLIRIISLTEEVGADVLLCGGDLYEHERFTPDTEKFLKEAFGRLGKTRVFLAPGNHDWYGPRSLYHVVEWSQNVHIFSEDRLTPISLDDGLTLWGAAHRAPADTPGFLDDFQVDRGGINLAVFHGSERMWFNEQESGKQPHAPFDASQIQSVGLQHAFLGHYHRPRDHQWFTYPGNPDPLSFGEDGERGAVIATVESDGRVSRERVTVAVSEVRDIEVDISGSESLQSVRDRVQNALYGLQGYARVTLNGEVDPNIDIHAGRLSTVQSSLDALVVVLGNLRFSYDFDSIAEEQTVRGAFVHSVLDEHLTEDEKRRILVTGLRALDGREDLEVF